MHRLAWEDFVVGAVTELGTLCISRDDIVEFAAEFDPQPMHLDDAAAAASMLGGLAASGWHTCCLMMRLLGEGLLRDAKQQIAPRWHLGGKTFVKPANGPGQALPQPDELRQDRLQRSGRFRFWIR